MTSQDPAIQRRRLRIALRDLRQRLELTQKQVADALDWSPAKLIRIENGTVTISRSDLIALLSHYGLDDQSRTAELLAMAQAAKQQSWSHYRDVHPPEFLTFLEFEVAASLIREFQPYAIPGLVQTEEYAYAQMRSILPDLGESVVSKRVQLRMERQELLTRSEPPALHMIVDEAVVRRQVGQRKVMIRQLERLREVARHPRFHLRILPFSAGAQPGAGQPFKILDFPDPQDDDLLYIEQQTLLVREKPEEVARYNSIYFALEEAAIPEERTEEVLDRVISEMDSGDYI